MNRLVTLERARDGALAQADAVVSAAGDQVLTAEQSAAYDAHMASVDAYSADISRERARQAIERSAPAVTNAQVGPDLATTEPWGSKTGAAMGEFLLAVRSATLNPRAAMDPRLQAASPGLGMNEAIGSEGGFLVNTDMATGILQRMYQTGELLRRVNRLPLTSGANGIELNAINETSRATGSRLGGVQGYWTDEGGSVTATRPKFKQLAWKLKKLAAIGYATDESLQDAGVLGAVMEKGFVDELTFLAEDSIYEGTGAGQPLGILSSPALISVTKETGQAAATVAYENIIKMWSRMWAPLRSQAVWLINQEIEPQLDQMSLSIGTGGVPAYLPAGGVADAPYGRLKGRPVIPIEYASALGTVGDIALVNLGEYSIIEKGGIQQAQSMHVAFLTDEMAFRCIYRIDGRGNWHSALTPFKGTNTLGPFVVLATRS